MLKPRGMELFTVYVSMEPAQNVWARDMKHAIQKVKKRFPNRAILGGYKN